MADKKYETVIGLEIHAEFSTHSKLFCTCEVKFGSDANTQTCPICLGMPGVLPVMNKRALEFAIRAGLAMNCKIASYSKFDRKNYFYPDLPKGYQISQYDLPLAYDGYVDFEFEDEIKRVRIHRVHLEEDAGKLVHADVTGDPNRSYVDFNRSCVPLLEIVSEPDLRSPAEAIAYWRAVKHTFPDAWGKPPTRSRLMHGAGIRAMGRLMDRVMSPVRPAERGLVAYAERELKEVASHCHWTQGKWEELELRWNEIQNVPRHIRLLSSHLVRLYVTGQRAS